jgi:hypothetical protein
MNHPSLITEFFKHTHPHWFKTLINLSINVALEKADSSGISLEVNHQFIRPKRRSEKSSNLKRKGHGTVGSASTMTSQSRKPSFIIWPRKLKIPTLLSSFQSKDVSLHGCRLIYLSVMILLSAGLMLTSRALAFPRISIMFLCNNNNITIWVNHLRAISWWAGFN